MRILVLSLVLANLGILAWSHWIAPPPAVAAPYDGPGMTLLRELEGELEREAPELAVAAPELAAEAPVTTTSDPVAESIEPGLPVAVAGSDIAAAQAVESAATGERTVADCLAVGPFTDPDIAAEAAATLAAAGLELTPRLSEEEVWDGYWVYVEQIDSRVAANEILADLSDNGIEDAYMIPNSDSGILVSLGVFSRIERAGAVIEQVGRLGIEPTLTERTRTAETTWFEFAPNDATSDVLGLLRTPGQISRLEQRACREAAVSAD